MSDKIQTLTCIGPPEHTWTRPSQRGKPPRYCVEHKPATEAPREAGTESESDRGIQGSASGGGGGSQSTSPSAGAATQENPFILKAQRDAQRKKMAELREKKSEKSEQQAIEEAEREQESM